MRYNPFNPTQPARPDFFVGREPEISEFEKILVQTINGSPMCMSITGNRGMGKTSLLVKFESIAKKEKCLVLRISNYEDNISGVADFCDYISSNLKREILSKKPLGDSFNKLQQWTSTFKPSIEWNDISLTVEKKQVVQEIFRKRLVKLWDEMKNDFSAVVVLIDEAESLENIKGIFTLLREVFQRIESETKYCLVLAGKLNFTERMSESFSPLNRFFPCSRLTSLDNKSMREYIIQRLASAKVGIDEEVIKYIIQASEGHPYVLVAICYLLFDSLNDEESHITKEILKRANDKITYRLAQDFFTPMFHPLTPKAKEIIIKIARNAKTLEFSFKDAVTWLDMPRSYVSPYIKELLRKGVLDKPERGRYRIFHTLFLEYLSSQN
ncbi:TPA: AAA family ATPase [archaeon]|nr:AAA family ATPase [Candidatus Naiadarchaeales archaeon SRR2090153.bin461]HIK02554.1 AAA family ATPase [Candidatus Naiadarchaeales archaeon SRR2090159.bin1288]